MVHGTRGSFLKYGEDPQEVFLRAGKLPSEIENWGCEPQEIFGLLHTETDGKIIKEKYPSLKGDYGFYYQNLYKTIRENAPLREKPEHGYNTIRLIELAIESNREKLSITCNNLINIAYPIVNT